jgi:hypothetical protein
LAAVEALGVSTEKDLHAVARVLGHLGGVHSGVQPRGERGVAKVVQGDARVARRPRQAGASGLPATSGSRSRPNQRHCTLGPWREQWCAQDGPLLAIRRADNGTWELPGGVLDPEEGVAREAWEETGLRVEVDELTGVYKNTTGGPCG